jgi:F0F1-type ATP synthase assembly protein I
MHDNTDNTSKRNEAAQRSDVASLVSSMAETTWRMFGPPAVLVPLGIWADISWRTKPWLTIAAAFVGLGLSIILVRQQMRNGQ